MDDEGTKLWEFLVGYAAIIFAVYPMTKDLIDNQTKTTLAMVLAVIFSFVLMFGLFIYFRLKKHKKS